jgi:CBS domain.|nr:MAG: CBS domain containing protein [Candidatus Nanosalinarum sp. J07AB56]
MTKVEKVMSEPDFIDVDASVEEAADELASAENTLIVMEDGEFIGEVHEHTVTRALIPEERLDEEKVIGIIGFSFDTSYEPQTVEDVVDRHEVSVPPGESLDEVAFLLDKEDLRSLPVIDGGDVVGVVHENDLMGEIAGGG